LPDLWGATFSFQERRQSEADKVVGWACLEKFIAEWFYQTVE